MKKWFFIVTLVLFATQILWGGSVEETFKKRLSVDGATLLTIENRNGGIEITSWDKDEIDIIAHKKVRGSGEEARRALEELKIVVNQRPDEIEIITEYPAGSGYSGGFWNWVMGRSGGINYSVHYEIRVPGKFDINAKSSNGNLTLSGCNGRIRLETSNGRIVAEDVKGALRCQTTNGSITASLLEVDESLDMNFFSTNGAIKLYLPANINADINARTTNGSISCDLPMQRSRMESRKRLEATLGNGGMQIHIKTTNGSIRISES